MTTPKTYHVKSFGCQMNVYDGERMGELMAAQGMIPAADASAADLVILNTCHIREKATEKVYSDIGRLRKDARLAERAAAFDPQIGSVWAIIAETAAANKRWGDAAHALEKAIALTPPGPGRTRLQAALTDVRGKVK